MLENPYVLILDVIDTAKLIKRIQSTKLTKKGGVETFHRNNVYIRKMGKRPIPEIYHPIISQIYIEHIKEQNDKQKEIDKLLKKNLQKERK